MSFFMFNLYSLLFLLVPIFGYVALRTLLGITSFVYLLPFSFVFGFSTFLVLVYGLAYFFGIHLGSLIAILILFLVSIILFFVYRDRLHIELSLLKRESIVLFFICLFISYFTFLISRKWIIFDFKFHISVASNFLYSDKFPQAVSNWPTLFVPYHYGFDLLSAIISSLTNLSIINSFCLIGVVSSITTFLSCVAIAYFFITKLLPGDKKRQTIIQAIFGGLFFYFAGNLLWLDALIRFLFKIPPVSQSWNLFQTFCAIGIHGSIMTDMGTGGILFASSTLGVQIFIFLLFLYLNFLLEKSSLVKYIVFILLTALALFHVAEWILYVFLLSLIISPFLSLLLKDGLDFKSFLQRNIIWFIVFLGIVFFNGFAYKMLSKDYSYLPKFLELTVNPNLFTMEVFGRFGNLNQHRNVSIFSWDFISEFGLTLIFSLFVIYWAVKQKINCISFVLSFLLISFISPLFLYIKSSPPDVIRLFHPGYEVLSLLFALWIFNVNNFKRLVLLLPVAVIVPPVLSLTLIGFFSPAIYLNHPYIGFVDYSLRELFKYKETNKFSKNINEGLRLIRYGALMSEEDEKMALFIKEHSKKGEYGLSHYPLPFDYVGIPCYYPRACSLPRKAAYLALLRTLDPYIIKELKIKWLLVTEEMEKFMNVALFEKLVKENFLKEVYSIDNPVYGKLRLFEFVNLDKYLYPQKTFWTFCAYMENNLIPIPESNGKQVLHLFKTEKEATISLRKYLETDKELKNYKAFVDLMDEEVIKQQATVNNLVIKYED